MVFGLFISISKYLKDDLISVSFVALLMIASGLYWVFSGDKATIWVLWKVFYIGQQNINYSIQSYRGSLFVAAIGAIVFHATNKWVKSWMPWVIDILFRMAIAVVITAVGIFFVIGPVVSFFQAILSIIIRAIRPIPYGLGAGSFAMAW